MIIVSWTLHSWKLSKLKRTQRRPTRTKKTKDKKKTPLEREQVRNDCGKIKEGCHWDHCSYRSHTMCRERGGSLFMINPPSTQSDTLVTELIGISEPRKCLTCSHGLPHPLVSSHVFFHLRTTIVSLQLFLKIIQFCELTAFRSARCLAFFTLEIRLPFLVSGNYVERKGLGCDH